MNQVRRVFDSCGVPVDFEELYLSEVGYSRSNSLDEVSESIKKNGICLKGALTSGSEGREGELATLNTKLRRRIDSFASVALVKSMEGLKTRHTNIDFVIIRETTEGEYSAIEYETVPGVVECLKIVTRVNSTRIAKFAFDYAVRNNRKKITAIHKANIMKLSDGLFLECCTQVSELYPRIKFSNMIIDNACMQLVNNPNQFDVMVSISSTPSVDEMYTMFEYCEDTILQYYTLSQVTPNLYGNIIDNLAAGLVGGAGVVPGEVSNYSVSG